MKINQSTENPTVKMSSTLDRHTRRFAVTYQLVVRQVSQHKAAVLLLTNECFVVESVVLPLIAQNEDVRHRVQLGSDVRLWQVLAPSPPPVLTVPSAGLQELPQSRRKGKMLALTS